MRKPTPLPEIELVESKYSYDPHTGEICFRQSGKPVRNIDRTTGVPKVRVGRVTTQAARLAWLLFYREDPMNYRVVHIDKNPFNNRISNLRKVRIG